MIQRVVSVGSSEHCEAEFPPFYSPSFWWLIGNHWCLLAYRSLPSFHLASHLCGLLSPKFLLSGHQSYWVGNPPYSVCVCVCVCMRSVTESYLTFGNTMDCSPPGSSVHGNFPGRNTGVGCYFLLQGTLPNPGIEPVSLESPALASRFFATAPPGKPSCFSMTHFN